MGLRLCPPECPDRTPGCHGTCEGYKKRKADYERRKEYIKKNREYSAYAASVAKKIYRWKRNHTKP